MKTNIALPVVTTEQHAFAGICLYVLNGKRWEDTHGGLVTGMGDG